MLEPKTFRHQGTLSSEELKNLASGVLQVLKESRPLHSPEPYILTPTLNSNQELILIKQTTLGENFDKLLEALSSPYCALSKLRIGEPAQISFRAILRTACGPSCCSQLTIGFG